MRTYLPGGGEDLQYIFSDHLGSTSEIVSADGNTVQHLRYTPFGSAWQMPSGDLATDYLYTGQLSMEEHFGLYYYNARWYDPVIGRFTQPDSIIPDPTDFMSWDRYAYVNNNPIMYNDPSGHFGLLGLAVGAAIGGAVSGITYFSTNMMSFNSNEYWIAVAGGAIAGGLLGSGIGLAWEGAVAAETIVGFTMETELVQLISAGTSASISGISYMIQSPNEFESAPYLLDTAISGTAGYISPGIESLGGRISLEISSAEISYLATTLASSNCSFNCIDGDKMVNIALTSYMAGSLDKGMEVFIPDAYDIFRIGKFTPESVVTSSIVEGFATNFGLNAMQVYAQNLALDKVFK